MTGRTILLGILGAIGLGIGLAGLAQPSPLPVPNCHWARTLGEVTTVMPGSPNETLANELAEGDRLCERRVAR